jgi:hypothetical protein
VEYPLQKLIYVIIFFLFMAGINSEPAIAQTQESWNILSPGIDYRVFQLPDPNQVYVARMDRKNQDVTLESGLSWGYLGSGRETVRDISKRYDDTFGYWGEKWGVRNKVFVAINGYYFNQETGLPWRGQVQSGWYIKRFDNFENGSGLVWKLNGDIFIGGCVSHPPAKQLISFENNQSQKFDGINLERGKNDLIIYTPQYSQTTGTSNDGVEIMVEMEQPLLIRQNKSKIHGIVREIHDHMGSTPIPFNAIILSASGSARKTLLANIKVGQKIGISQQISHFKADCKTSDPNDWSNAYSAIGGDFVFLEAGENNYIDTGSANVRAPRTAVAYNDQYIYFIVVDGRNPGISIGMSMWHLAEFAKSYLNAEWGIAEDSGGSSTMVIDGEVVNNTFCNFNDCEQLSIFTPQPLSPPGTSLTVTTNLYDELASNYQTISESLVGNALMMVSVQPVLKSKTFLDNDSIRTVSKTDLRLGPGSNYFPIKSVPLYSNLVVSPSLNDLNGVYTKGEFWWYVTYANTKGWIAENSLAGGISPSHFTFIPNFFNYRKR